jgi:DNA (cytosine-5)-methyltransferase 1
MSEPSLFEDLTEFADRWPKSGIMLRGRIYGPAMWERPTNEPESGLWPTPRAGNPGSRPNKKGGKILAEEVKKAVLIAEVEMGPTLPDAIVAAETIVEIMEADAESRELFPTPTAEDSHREKYMRGNLSLSGYATLWPTPNARDWKGKSRTANYNKASLADAVSERDPVKFPTPGTTGLSNGSGNCASINKLYKEGKITEAERRSMRSGNGGQLNPAWVDWLMGYPIGWTDLNASVTPLSLKFPS